MLRSYLIVIIVFASISSKAQLMIARDTITVLENGYVLKMPWANGINFSNVSTIDLNFDGKKDVVAFDRINQFGTGRFRCFINEGTSGQTKYRADLSLSYLFPQAANWAVLVDYNCDGKEDLFVSTSAGIKVYRNTSTPSNILNFTLVKPLLYSDYNPAGSPYISNLYASSVGVPGIADIDNDGDLDILSFAPQGVFVEYHKNMSKELYNHCDSLVFDVEDLCWGKISESNCTVVMGQCPQNKLNPLLFQNASKTYHAGSCLACIDSDSDGDQDLIMGDVSCNIVQYVHNTGSAAAALFTDTTKLYPNFPTKNNTTQLKLNNFPCTYYIDVDGDNKKDLVATPNAFGSENYKSVWYYKNTSTTGTVSFQFVKNNFLQDEMIEVGQNSFPVLLDYNVDGKKDLLVGSYGYYTNNTLSARLTLYQNIGTTAIPAFSLITRDYANIGTQNLNNAVPTVGDIDSDGDVDICLGTGSGQIHWVENTAGAGNVCNFSVFQYNPFTFTTSSAVAAPQLFDLNNDGKLDLLIGMKNGRVAYYQNSGTASAPAYTLITNNLGGIDVKGDPYLYGIDGYAVPFFYKDNGVTECLIGSVSGNIWHYSVPATLTSPFPLMSNGENGLNEGAQSTVWYEDINQDNKRDLFVGNGSGGLTYFSSSSLFVGISDGEQENILDEISLYPNPSENYFSIRTGNQKYESIDATIIDLSGRMVKHLPHCNSQVIDTSDLEKGIYLVKVNVNTSSVSRVITKFFVKE